MRKAVDSRLSSWQGEEKHRRIEKDMVVVVRMSLKRCNSQREHGELKDDKNSYPQHLNTKRKKVTSNCLLLELPHLPVNLICDILSRLPVDTILSCKCVCKTFLDVLRDPYFATLHLARSSDIDYRLIVPETVSPFNIYLLPILDLERSASQSHWQTLAMPSTLSQSTTYSSLIGSYNGLVCIYYLSWSGIDMCVYNPILGEFMMLPQPWPRGIIMIPRFGFCPNTKQYKVIRFRPGLQCEIYTLGTGEWRRIENAPSLEFPSVSSDSSVNGILHWIVTITMITKKIRSFNLETEQFSHIYLPAHFDKENEKEITCMNTGILNGLLCLYYVVDSVELEICVMKEYGVKESWTKTLKIYVESLGIYPVKILNNRGLFFIHNYKTLFCYNSLVGTIRNINSPKPYHVTGYDTFLYGAIGHVPSFISLKDIAGEENVELVQSRRSNFDKEADSTRGYDKCIITRNLF